MAELINCSIGEIIAVLAGLGIVVDVSPVKVYPVRYLLRILGNALNADLKEQIASIDLELQRLNGEVVSDRVNNWRHDILEFANSCMYGNKHTKEEFDHVLKIHDEYEKYINDNCLENGQVDVAFAFISKIYRDCLEKKSFL